MKTPEGWKLFTERYYTRILEEYVKYEKAGTPANRGFLTGIDLMLRNRGFIELREQRVHVTGAGRAKIAAQRLTA